MTVQYTPGFARATHAGLAVLAIHAMEMGACELQGPHPEGEKPLHYDAAIDPRTGLNWMDTPTTISLPGTEPQYLFQPSPILAQEWNVPNPTLEALGYLPGASYFLPAPFLKLLDQGEIKEEDWPKVWDRTQDIEEEVAAATEAGMEEPFPAPPYLSSSKSYLEFALTDLRRMEGSREASIATTRIEEALLWLGRVPADAGPVQLGKNTFEVRPDGEKSEG